MMRTIVCAIVLLVGIAFSAFAQNIQSDPQIDYSPPSTDNGEVLIDFANEDSPSTISGILDKFGITGKEFSIFSSEEKWVRLRHVTAAMLTQLKQRSDVEAIEPNYYVSALYTPNDPYYKHQWHLDLIGMKKAWDYPAGAKVIVAVIDTGIAYEKYQDHFRVEDLGESQFVSPYNFVAGTPHANDDHGHGTHVAGTIAQLTNNGVGVAGVAPRIKLMPLKVLNSYGYGTYADIAAAIRYAADHGASVINMSLGGPFPSFILHKAIKYAHKKGVVIVCAAGNSGRSGISYPAHYEECISVSAVRFDRTLTWYSSYGKGLTIAAPGGDMNVDQNGDGLMDGVLQNTLNPQDTSQQGYFLFQGTSMASPHVAAVAALLVSHGINDPDTVKSYLQKTATQVEGGTPDKYGAGVVDASAAIRSAFFMRKSKILLLALILLILFLTGFNRKKRVPQKVPMNFLSILGLIFGSTGLFFLGTLPYVNDSFLAMHNPSEWQFALFGGGSASPLFFSALPALLLMVFYPWRRMIPFIVGFVLGVAAFLLFQIASPTTNISWIPGRFLEILWLGVNVTVTFILAIFAGFRLR